MLKSLKNVYMQYEMVTNIYMFEPWEKKLINGFVAFILVLVIFSSCVYLPTYIETFLQFVSPVPSSPYVAPILQAKKMGIS